MSSSSNFEPPFDYIAAIGDVTDSGCWSGIPYHFYRATQRLNCSVSPCKLNLANYRWRRRYWNLAQMLMGRGRGGYQYSAAFLAQAEAEVLADCKGKTILSFHHHFPRAKEIKKAGGRVVYYLDATLAAQLDGHAININIPPYAIRKALAIERENLAEAFHVFTMARWLRDYLVDHKFVPVDRISVVLPGANLDIPMGWRPKEHVYKNGPFILGLVGNDWRRKGLPLLIKVARKLCSQGIPVKIRVIGNCPSDIAPDCVDVIGPVDKVKDQPRFIDLVGACDIGCLFSNQEALGISVLEFLRLGVPVAGFTLEGPRDTIPPDAGFRIESGASIDDISKIIALYVADIERQKLFRNNAIEWSTRLSWERCLSELAFSLESNEVTTNVRPWMGLNQFIKI